ncbi:MAG: aminopeptidase P family protein [Sporichthyaceae bacterium]
MPDSHARRRDLLRARFVELDLDAALVTDLTNIRYLSGFTGSHAALLVSAEHTLLATDGRYTTQALTQAPDAELITDRACALVLTERAARLGVRRLGFEAHKMTVEAHQHLQREHADLEFAPLGQQVEDLRAVKDEAEIALLRAAAAIADSALAEVMEGLVSGRSERHVARELERRMLDKGAEAPAFDTIVAAGENSAIPHHRPTERRICDGDLLKIDFGARVEGYHSDMTRTFVIGTEPAPWQIELYDLVFAAQRAGREALAPGVEVVAVDAAARAVIVAAGHGEHYLHGLGHGIGLAIHEAPLIGPTSAGRLRALTPVTVEPGVYLSGIGGIRIEDTLVVRDEADGGAELLTLTTKELLVLD